MKGRVLYVPEAVQGRLTFLGQEIPIRPEDVAHDARRPGTRVRFDLFWVDDDLADQQCAARSDGVGS